MDCKRGSQIYASLNTLESNLSEYCALEMVVTRFLPAWNVRPRYTYYVSNTSVHRCKYPQNPTSIEEKGYIDLTLACVQFIVSTTRTWWKRRYFLGTKPKKSWGVRRIKLKAFAVGYWIYVYLILRKNWMYYTSLHFFVVLLSRWNFVVFLYSFRYLQFFYLFWDRSYASLKIPKIIKNKLRITKIWNFLFL